MEFPETFPMIIVLVSEATFGILKKKPQQNKLPTPPSPPPPEGGEAEKEARVYNATLYSGIPQGTVFFSFQDTAITM